ncbi:MAG: ribonuclease HI family protein [Candidatus ainarchaeum sp.]|nr:ribonuclease HI family protein [Candidatus ainarchaeum sp.]
MLTINTDGACFSNPGPMGIGVVIIKKGKIIGQISEFLGKGTNNIAEYTAVLKALEFAKKLGETEVEIRSDSQLLVKQLKGEYKLKAPHLRELKHKILEAAKGMDLNFKWVPREQNGLADKLSKDAIVNKI